MPRYLHRSWDVYTAAHEVSDCGAPKIARDESLIRWVNLDRKEICFPTGVLKNKKPLIVPLSGELVGMLKKRFRGGPVFDMTNFRRELNKACVKVGLGQKTGEEWYKYFAMCLIPVSYVFS
jgi:hypothetical protein